MSQNAGHNIGHVEDPLPKSDEPGEESDLNTEPEDDPSKGSPLKVKEEPPTKPLATLAPSADWMDIENEFKDMDEPTWSSPFKPPTLGALSPKLSRSSQSRRIHQSGPGDSCRESIQLRLRPLPRLLSLL